MPTVPVDREVDARVRGCPVPLMELMRLVHATPVGSVLSSDPVSDKEIPSWIQLAGHEDLGTYQMEGYTRFVKRKAH